MVSPQYEIEYSEEKVTAWGGMRLMKEVLERSGASGLLGALALPEPGSNRGYDPRLVVESYLVNIWMGCYCASGSGVLSVVDATGDLKLLGTVATQKGARSVAVDQKSHAVWIAYSSGKDAPAFIQKLK